LAFRGIAAAHILHDHHEAARDSLSPKVAGVVLVIRSALEQYGKAAIARGAVDIGAEGDAITGFHGNVALDGDVGGRLSEQAGGAREDRGNDNKAQKNSGHEDPPAKTNESILKV